MTPIAQKLGVKPDPMPMGGQMSSGMMTDANTLGISKNQMGMSMNMTHSAAQSRLTARSLT